MFFAEIVTLRARVSSIHGDVFLIENKGSVVSSCIAVSDHPGQNRRNGKPCLPKAAMLVAEK